MFVDTDVLHASHATTLTDEGLLRATLRRAFALASDGNITPAATLADTLPPMALAQFGPGEAVAEMTRFAGHIRSGRDWYGVAFTADLRENYLRALAATAPATDMSVLVFDL